MTVLLTWERHDKAALRPPGVPPLTDAAAAQRVYRSDFEPRPANRAANRRMPSRLALSRLRAASNYARRGTGGARYIARVTGRFTGTTDEIIQWAAWKWGLDEDLLRAQSVQESRWRQSAVGDGGLSFGLLQIKRTSQRGTFPLSRDYTAFNADYAAMILRHCFDGRATWLAHGYRAGDLAGCLDFFFSGRWHDSQGLAYTRRVALQVILRDWARPDF